MVTRFLQRASTAEELLHVLSKDIGRPVFNEIHASTAFSRLAKLKWTFSPKVRTSPVLESLVLRTQQYLEKGSFTARQCATVIWAITSLRGPLPELKEQLMPALVRASERQTAGMTAQDVANIMWAAATLNEADLIDQLMPALVQAAKRELPHMRPQETANIIWAAARLRTEAPVLQQLVPDLVQAAEVQMDSMNAQGVTMIIWAMATIRSEAPMLQQLIPAWMYAAERVMDKLNPQGVANIFWAAATLRIDELDEFIPFLAEKRLPRVAQDMNAQNVANVFWAVGKLELDSSLADHVLRTTLPRLREVLSTSDPLTMVSISIGMASCGCKDTPLLKSIAALVVDVAPTWPGETAMFQLPRIAWAFARLREYDLALLCTIAEHALITLPDMESWHLCALLWSFRELDPGSQFAAIRKALEAEMVHRGLSDELVARAGRVGPDEWQEGE